MDPSNFIDPNLTEPDLLVLKTLLHDAEIHGSSGSLQPEEKGNDRAEARNRGKCMSTLYSGPE